MSAVMPDSQGRASFKLPSDLLESLVLPTQRRIYEETGQVLSVAKVVRYLIEKGFTAEQATK